jgi:hypothetical protein
MEKTTKECELDKLVKEHDMDHVIGIPEQFLELGCSDYIHLDTLFKAIEVLKENNPSIEYVSIRQIDGYDGLMEMLISGHKPRTREDDLIAEHMSIVREKEELKRLLKKYPDIKSE